MADIKHTVIEQTNSLFRKTEASLEDKNSTLHIKSISDASKHSDFKKPTIKSDKVLLAFNSDNASTIQKVIKLKRKSPKSDLTKEEVDKLVFKALWEFLNEYRSWSFHKMGVTGLDMVLAGIYVSGVFLDDRKVLDPTGFTGEELTLKLIGTFIPRKMLPIAEYFSEFGKSIKVVEKFSVPSLSLSESLGNVFYVGMNNSYVFSLTKEEVKFSEKHKIGINDFVNTISDSLNIKDWESKEVLKRYFNESLSKKASSFIKSEIDDKFDKIKDIADKLLKDKDNLLINIPEEFYNELFSDKSNVKRINFRKMLETKGFNVIINEENRPLFDEDSYLILSSYPIGSHHYKRINDLLEKRSKWLVPSDTNK